MSEATSVFDLILDRGGAARYLKIGKSSLDILVHAGEVPYLKIGRRVLFQKAKLDEWLDAKSCGKNKGARNVQ